MKVVIDTDEKHLKTLQKMSECGLGYYQRAVLNGTVLPKGHGRLIDADALVKKGDITKDYLNIFAPTIIEADKGDEE